MGTPLSYKKLTKGAVFFLPLFITISLLTGCPCGNGEPTMGFACHKSRQTDRQPLPNTEGLPSDSHQIWGRVFYRYEESFRCTLKDVDATIPSFVDAIEFTLDYRINRLGDRCGSQVPAFDPSQHLEVSTDVTLLGIRGELYEYRQPETEATCVECWQPPKVFTEAWCKSDFNRDIRVRKEAPREERELVLLSDAAETVKYSVTRNMEMGWRVYSGEFVDVRIHSVLDTIRLMYFGLLEIGETQNPPQPGWCFISN